VPALIHRRGRGSARRCSSAFAAAALLASGTGQALAQTADLVDRSTLRVCADPGNTPMSNDKLEGFENKIAALLGSKLRIPVEYTWFPQATGFVRQTLSAKNCDLIIGFAQGDELVQNTNHYYKSIYVLFYNTSAGLDGIESLDDPRLKDKRIGVVAGTPPADILVANHLIGNAMPFPLTVDRRFESPADVMINAVKDGTIAAGILWGPIGGPQIKKLAPDLVVVPLNKETKGPHMSYRITMGLRPNEPEWKHQLNAFIKDNQGEINKILLDAGVPLVDEKDQPITH
jgi:quinoprotein dehydrogenase-associated probable ABC transporter substrate-binding protein